ncbi:hypothetical protein ykris0001_34200 [Yersinia kristensenii ATCC 33638]|nr:hypothetical protein ykris0001_20610 [Yersinia kristensenii ATCC 33638]EEP93295.1 hypothetical protein ykris0001_34200 [Yersinia kristensenii ATCC 33638]
MSTLVTKLPPFDDTSTVIIHSMNSWWGELGKYHYLSIC